MDLTGLLSSVVTQEEKVFLCEVPTEEEVREAVFSISWHSSPSLYGFGSSFYMSCWELVKEDVVEVVRDFFNRAALPRFYSSSYIVLIPKLPDPKCFDKFRPVNLCFVAYKFLSKILVKG